MNKWMIIVMILLFPQGVWAQAPVEDVRQEFSKANTAYRNGEFDAAIKSYEAILNQGWESGPIYYNLGNSYFKRGNIGKATLYYERASRLMPRDADLQANLKFLASVKDSESVQLSWIQKIYSAHHRFYTTSEMVLIVTVLGVALGIWHLVCLYGHWPTRLLVKGFMIGGIVLIVYGVGLWEKWSTEQNAAVVIMDTPARFEPRDKATTYFELLAGQKVKALETEGDWQKIERSDKKMGWIPKTSTERI